MGKSTSWGEVADWYDEHLEGEDTYQKKVILPNLKRLLSIKGGERVLDLACGSGFFSREMSAWGGKVTGADLSEELVKKAKEKSPESTFVKSSADDLSTFENSSFDKVINVLAIQNIEPVKKMLEESFRVLAPKGKMYIVMNHPAFRIPKASGWGFDEDEKKQYRRIDRYLSESKEKIVMNPGNEKSIETVSFHRPLQYYFKLFGNTGFAISRLEEWTSHKKSEPGPRQSEEDRMRKEIPLFLYVEIIKLA